MKEEKRRKKKNLQTIFQIQEDTASTKKTGQHTSFLPALIFASSDRLGKEDKNK